MKISKKREQALYDAMARKIMDLRIEIKKNPKLLTPALIDDKLFYLEQAIGKAQEEVLK